MFFLKKKKENKIEEFNYVGFTTWLNKILQNSLPENTKAVNFNIYEEPQPHIYGIQFVATSSFDLNNDDWACDEIFSSNENIGTKMVIFKATLFEMDCSEHQSERQKIQLQPY